MNIKCFFLSLIVMCIFSCNSDKQNPYVGVYKLDLLKSKLNNYANIDSLSELQLKINSDGSFEYSKNIPFIFSTVGKWEIRHLQPLDGPPTDYCYFNYGDNNRNDVLLPMSEEDSKYINVYFNYPLSQKNAESVEVLAFIRVK